MCEEGELSMKRLIASIFSGSATTTAKAAPGLVVTSLSFAGISLEAWVTVLTVAYLLLMCIGALPRVFETIRCIWRLIRPKKTGVLVVQEVESRDVEERIRRTKDAAG